MRPYFKQILEETYETFGTRQCENMDDEQYTRLLDKLVFVSSLYPYIPEEEQKKIIDKRLVTDKEYRNINARLISGWLEADGKQHFVQLCHEPIKPEAFATSEQRDEWIEKWKKALLNIETNFNVNTEERKGSGSRLRENLEGAGIVVPPTVEPKEEPKHFCVMPKVCAQQCERCKSESEIISKSEELTNPVKE